LAARGWENDVQGKTWLVRATAALCAGRECDRCGLLRLIEVETEWHCSSEVVIDVDVLLRDDARV
jgi:hypothetical protein